MEVNYRYNSKLEQPIKDGIEHIRSKDYGDTIQYSELSEIFRLNLEIEEDKKQLKYIMSKVKNTLIDYGYVLRNITGIGYYILKPKEISSYTYRTYIVKPANLYNKANRILDRVDKTMLNKIRKQEHKEVKELTTDLIDITLGTIELSDYYKNKDEYEKLK